MDISFELSKKLNQLCIQSCLKRQDKETLYIYFDESKPFDLETKKIPTLENFAFALALFNQKSQESFQLAIKILEKLFSYYKAGNFPRYLSDFPHQESPYIGAYVYPYLFKIVKNFQNYLPKDLSLKIQTILNEIKINLSNLNIYHHLQPLNEAIIEGKVTNIYQSFESALAVSIVDEHSIHVKDETSILKFLERGHLMLSLFDFIKAQNQENYSPYLLDDHPLHLKLSLFYEPFHKRKYPSALFHEKSFYKGFCWHDTKGNQAVFCFDEGMNAMVDSSSEMTLEGNLESQSEIGVYFPIKATITQFDKKGTYFLKNEAIVVQIMDKTFEIISDQNMALSYQKNPYELFDGQSSALKIHLSGPYKIRIRYD